MPAPFSDNLAGAEQPPLSREEAPALAVQKRSGDSPDSEQHEHRDPASAEERAVSALVPEARPLNEQDGSQVPVSGSENPTCTPDLDDCESRLEEQTARRARTEEALHETAVALHDTASALVETTSALRESEERFRRAFEDAAIGMAIVGLDGQLMRVNRAVCDMLGYTQAEMQTTTFQALTHPEDLNTDLGHVEELLSGQVRSYTAEKRYIHHDGHVLWMLVSRSVVRASVPLGAPEGTLGEPLYFVSQAQDVTQARLNAAQLRHEALHDALTGLPNRSLFEDRLGHAIRQYQRRPDSPFAVLFMDLDRFKNINDSLGHGAGDLLLKNVALRLQHELRGNDSIARFGGDEFAILLDNVSKPSDAVRVSARIQHSLSQPFNLDGREVFVSVSIGVSMGRPDYQQPQDALRDADLALYRAKSMGRNCCQIFNEAMHENALNLLQTETDLRYAVERGELRAFYQPIISLGDGRLLGFEALVRWMHPTRGLVSPAEFIPVAEESGLIVPLGRWMLRESCRQLRTWQQEFPGYGHLTMNVNVATKQITQASLVDHVDEALGESGLLPQCLKLEITESGIMESGQVAASTLVLLRNRGVRLQIDDFGTGYSSLAYLHRIPVEALKIDRSFVEHMAGEGGQEQTEIVRAVVTLAHALNLGVIAEGVETRAQVAQLRALNCGAAQGFLFSRPLTTEAAEQLLRENRPLLEG